jgi:hypothetical protein
MQEKNMTNEILNNKEIDQLTVLFKRIVLGVYGDFPSLTNRLVAVEDMIKVIQIHGYEVSKKEKEVQL